MFEPSVAPPPDPGECLWFAFSRRRLLVQPGYEPLRGVSGALPLPATAPFHYLGKLDGVCCFCVELNRDYVPNDGQQLVSLTVLATVLEAPMFALVGRAVQVLDWYQQHAFCGACGGRTFHQPESGTRSRRCGDCALECYPRLAPVVIAAVRRDDAILMARPVGAPANIYSLIAGFVEPGENLEDAVVREVREETGLSIGNVRYHSSQPWPFPGSLLVGFTADYVAGEITLDVELEAAAFFRAHAMPPMIPGEFSVSQRLIAEFLKQHGRTLESCNAVAAVTELQQVSRYLEGPRDPHGPATQ